MNATIDFKSHAERKIKEYEKLKLFTLNPDSFSEPIPITKDFLIQIQRDFDFYIKRRGESKKFTQKENKELKKLLVQTFPYLKPLDDHKSAAVYWFKINNPSVNFNKEIFEFSKNFRKDTGRWFTQVSEVRTTKETEFLYVGKVEAGLFNRFLQHIGLGHKFTTGLQMVHWATNLGALDLEYRFCPINIEYLEMLEDIEEVIWSNSRPLLGEGKIRE